MSSPEHFSPSDQIDTRTREIIENVYGINNAVYVANELPIEFLDRPLEDRIKNPPLGRSWLSFSQVPEDDKGLYLTPGGMVLYPPFTDKEMRRHMVRNRISAIRKVEKAYGVKMKHFKDIDEYPIIGIATIAQEVDNIKLGQLQELANLSDD